MNITFMVIDSNGKEINNLKSIEECFNYSPSKIYETTFGEKQLIAFQNKDKYMFSWFYSMPTIDALKQLKEYNDKHGILNNPTKGYLETQIQVFSDEIKCDMNVLHLQNRIWAKQRLDDVYFGDIVKKLGFNKSTTLSINIFVDEKLYSKEIVLSKKKPHHTLYLNYLQENAKK